MVKHYMKRCLWCGVMVVLLLATGCDRGPKKEIATALPKQQSNMETVSIYSIDSDTMTLVPVMVKKEKSKLTPTYIASLVEDSLEDETVRLYSVEQVGEKVYISFYRKGKPIKNCSKKMETLILDCFANSLLDNVKKCKKIIVRCENKAYKSDNYSFKINDVYASK